MLEETDTLCLIDIPSVCVSNDNLEEVIIVKAANAKYKEVSKPCSAKILLSNNIIKYLSLSAKG